MAGNRLRLTCRTYGTLLAIGSLSINQWHADCFYEETKSKSLRGNRPPGSVTAIQKEQRVMINFILWLLFGALVGWLASIVMRTDAQQGALLNIVVGIIGAMLGGFLFNLLGIGGANINNSDFSLSALIVSFIGAVILLGIVNLVRRGSVR
jgi:uncharacterized membrane protein YeaQ/YmgE (transglycosylase-associated protein family)